MWLAGELIEEGLVARIVTRDEGRRAGIEALGAECWVGDPNRLASVVGALEGVTIACWLLGSASGEAEQLQALHGPILESFLSEAIDTTMRGFVYEAAGSVPEEMLVTGVQAAKALAQRNLIPLRVLDADPAAQELWRSQALEAVSGLLTAR
jgi:hypothetical protein